MNRETCTYPQRLQEPSGDKLNINQLINWKGRYGAYYDLYGAEIVRTIHHKFRC